jgi:hypothetical protein
MTVEPETMQGFLTAFKLALSYVTKHPSEFPLSPHAAQEELILLISRLARSGEDNPVILADMAISQMRKRLAVTKSPSDRSNLE